MLGSGILWMSSIAMLLFTLGVILAAKIILAFLLALGPVFIALFLFEPTRGLFDGWLRTTIAFALAPLAANVFGAAMLIMLQPFLTQLAAKVAQRVFDMGPIITIGLIVAIFGIITAMAMRMGAGIASGLASSRDHKDRSAAPQTASSAPAPGLSPDRAEEIAARVAMSSHPVQAEGQALATRRAHDSANAVADLTPVSQRLGQTYRRGSRAQPSPVGSS